MNHETRYAWGFATGILLGALLLCGILGAACYYAPQPTPRPSWEAAQLPTGEHLACYAKDARGWVCVPTDEQQD